MLPVQIVSVGDKEFFVCNATGALISRRFFFPGKEKYGCFVTLPVALKWLEKRVYPDKFEQIKRVTCEYFEQKNIPMQPRLPTIPLGDVLSVRDYLNEMYMGEHWLMVDKAETVPEYYAAQPKKRKRRRVAKGCPTLWN